MLTGLVDCHECPAAWKKRLVRRSLISGRSFDLELVVGKYSLSYT